MAIGHRAKRTSTACGDRTRDQSIKSRTLYLTELKRPAVLPRGQRGTFGPQGAAMLELVYLSPFPPERQAWVIGLVV